MIMDLKNFYKVKKSDHRWPRQERTYYDSRRIFDNLSKQIKLSALVNFLKSLHKF